MLSKSWGWRASAPRYWCLLQGDKHHALVFQDKPEVQNPDRCSGLHRAEEHILFESEAALIPDSGFEGSDPWIRPLDPTPGPDPWIRCGVHVP